MKLTESLMTRREFIRGWMISMASFFAGSVFYPFFRFLTPREMDAGPSEIKLPLAECNLAPNTGKIFPFGRKPGLLIVTEQGEWIALNAVCTHFECTVHYDAVTRQIVCPCHQGFYDVYGKNIKGPPPRPLERYEITRDIAGLVISKPGKKKETKK
ncbi:MAG: hypothetical protein A3G33_05905 [Omnitrophica bacterium RIFCSPLOWO2_12_FULL_44_17]|uniref:Rieske domain-containing protein n=1 Tax=Candidatus Danuiimicrobium aquiferis TaxID=1801832 RepID=A0A1G1L2D8_9BACT|nr:MAG: hypothetical protein A3B72_06135 [Omnitrophica bacterium RIFCSPHIGHO2_02_FULL_45_28]OGW90029.1 MAG: hypothetical protein A3E74_08880 [Omnitrophica bacterium RIFCSPHIGHO2_12_FULL_44_12]OGW99323.1 MAG: hypothetical protein A3G33_05905 [Omnitrophica bacterium RIFCSPLOWO2_12_FULL_44_17]OGX02476.1 MAG: hypothetical protein A3J12_09305 [Omnitrophica bacterium RIFCSPLOWO2_02_FULL_44_11]